MAYTELKNNIKKNRYKEYESKGMPFPLEGAVLSFIRESCEGLRFEDSNDLSGKSIGNVKIPINMEKDIDRLCLENAVDKFLKSGRKEDAFCVYFCYLDMFIGDYEKTRRMIELLSEFEANGSGLLMKHRDHYSHSVYVFCLGLAIYYTNKVYRQAYKDYYKINDENKAACHFLQYWGLSSLFHDIGYPFELPFEQVASYFEVNGEKRKNRPFVAYHNLKDFIKIQDSTKDSLRALTGKEFSTINELFASILVDKLGSDYNISKEQMLEYLDNKPTNPDMFGHFMDHAYFSSTVLFKKLFEEMNCELQAEHLDALTAILMHNSLYKFCIANPNMDPENPKMHLAYKKEGNIPFKMGLHPLAYMLMLCDELQCWDRTAYGRNSKKELHPMGCTFDFSDGSIKAVYLFDEAEMIKVNSFKDAYIQWLLLSEDERNEKIMVEDKEEKKYPCPELKAYSGMYIKGKKSSDFQSDIERIVDLTDIKLSVETGLTSKSHSKSRGFLSDSNFINLYNFAIVLNGRWNSSDWKKAKEAGQEELFLMDEEKIKEFSNEFKKLSLEYKLSNINQAKAFARYMEEIGCFYTDKSVDFEVLTGFSDEEMLKIGIMEHQRWLQEHYDMGWKYGEPDKTERELLRQHKDMIPGFDGFDVSDDKAKLNYDRLDKAEQDKDTEPMECMLAMLKMYDGIRIYRL